MARSDSRSRETQPQAAYRETAGCTFRYTRVGYDSRLMVFNPDGTIGDGAAGCEQRWSIEEINGELRLLIFGDDRLTCVLSRRENGWRGHWEQYERMPIELEPVATTANNRPEGGKRAAASTGERPPGAPCMPFKVFGLQRTCTNLVQRAVLDNFQAELLGQHREWKHGPIGRVASAERQGQLARVMVCVRSPYAWLVSCYKYFHRVAALDPAVCPHFRRGTFAEFVRSRHYEWPSPVERWNEMNAHWGGFVRESLQRAAVVRAEDLQGAEDQIRQLARLEASLLLPRRIDETTGEARPLAAVTRRVNIEYQLTKAEMDFDYYREERFFAEYDSDLLHFVNLRLDWSLMQEFEYARFDV